MSFTDDAVRGTLLMGLAACSGPGDPTPSTSVDPWTTLGESWRQSTMSEIGRAHV
jgi:hypothetical protein